MATIGLFGFEINDERGYKHSFAETVRLRDVVENLMIPNNDSKYQFIEISYSYERVR